MAAPGLSRWQPTVVLVRPQEEGNVGAVARAMANMGLRRLVLVEPAVAVGGEARSRARSAESIHARAKRVPTLAEALGDCQQVVGTTSLRGRQLPRPPLSPRELARRLAAGRPASTSLVFGPERSGLTGGELALCSTLVTIPAARRHPTLNLAQAVLIVAYELYLSRLGAGAEVEAGRRRPAARAPTAGREAPAAFGEIEGLFSQLEPFLAEIGFARDTTFAGVLRDLRSLAARSALTRREVAIVRGICRRASLAAKRAAAPP
jgi:tRNA (cytidine32/uridine32-2'-O)-methyltransferase